MEASIAVYKTLQLLLPNKLRSHVLPVIIHILGATVAKTLDKVRERFYCKVPKGWKTGVGLVMRLL